MSALTPEAVAAVFRKAIADRKGVYAAKLEQATKAERFNDDYTRCDLFRHAVEAFEHLELEIDALLQADPQP